MLDMIKQAFACTIGICLGVGFVLGLIMCACWSEKELSSKKLLFIPSTLLVMGFLITILNCLTPTTKMGAAIYVIPRAIKSESFDKAMDIPSKLLDLANNKIDELLDIKINDIKNPKGK